MDKHEYVVKNIMSKHVLIIFTRSFSKISKPYKKSHQFTSYKIQLPLLVVYYIKIPSTNFDRCTDTYIKEQTAKYAINT